jgi:HAD superfamily hydrolase (TIGR01544 family)
LLKLKKNSFVVKSNYNQIINIVNDYNQEEEIHIVEEHLKSKINEFKKNSKRLTIVSDFDYTLTNRYHDEHGSLYSSYCILECSDSISEKFRKENKELFDKYSHIENDITLDFSERDFLIRKWFKDNLDLIIAEDITKSDFRKMVLQAENKFFFRYGILEFFELLFHNDIPIYIISGGIYEIIDEALKMLLPHYEHMREKNLIHIISNKFTYDNNDKVIGYEEPFVYTFNKGEVILFN